VAVDREHVVAQPHARIGEAHAGGCRALGEDGRERPGVDRLDPLLERQEPRRLGQQPAVDPAGHEPVVVVAGQDEQLAVAAEGLAQLREQRARQLRRRALRPVAQLEAVAEDHEAVHRPHRLEQRLAQLRPPQQVGSRGRAEVQVRDHERPHRH
jgi:hypothetical protein